MFKMSHNWNLSYEKTENEFLNLRSQIVTSSLKKENYGGNIFFKFYDRFIIIDNGKWDGPIFHFLLKIRQNHLTKAKK